MLSGQRGERERTSQSNSSANGKSSRPIEKPVRKLKQRAAPTSDQAQNQRQPRPSLPGRPPARQRTTSVRTSAIGKIRIILPTSSYAYQDVARAAWTRSVSCPLDRGCHGARLG